MQTIHQSGGFADAREFYDYLLNRLTVKFNPRPPADPDRESFELTLSRRMSYDQYSSKVGEYLGADPTHIRFSTVNSTTGKPKAAVRRNQNLNLYQVLFPQYGTYNNSNQRSDALYYEVMDMSLSELETKKNLRITLISEGITKEVRYLRDINTVGRAYANLNKETFDILVAKNGTVRDLIAGLQKKASLSDEAVQAIRVYEAHNSKVYKELSHEYNVASITDFVTLYAESIPEDERNASEDDRLIYAFHFDKEPNKPHGVPFKFVMKPVWESPTIFFRIITNVAKGEAFKDTKERLSNRTGIKGKLFDKIRFAIVQRTSFSKPIYLSEGKPRLLASKLAKTI